MAADTAIEVVLARSGLTFIVPPDKSILQVLIEEGIDPMYDCQRGECGTCQVTVLEGEPDHRDHILSESERAGNKVIQICVSRAKTARLVLDM
ncbi:MAG: 2Fe-2S iron-sulfur cluster binding domain-containing protein [Xanthobacteraceae bacterium]|jgi:ferredoxin